MTELQYVILIQCIVGFWVLSGVFRIWLNRRNRKQANDYQKHMEEKVKQLSEQIEERAYDMQEVMNMVDHEYKSALQNMANDPNNPIKEDLDSAIESIKKARKEQDPGAPKRFSSYSKSPPDSDPPPQSSSDSE